MAAQRNVFIIVQIALFAHFALHQTTAVFATKVTSRRNLHQSNSTAGASANARAGNAVAMAAATARASGVGAITSASASAAALDIKGIMPASAPFVQRIINAVVAQPCVPATVSAEIGTAIAGDFLDAPAAVFSALSAQGITPQLLCFGDTFGIAYKTAAPFQKSTVADAFTNAVMLATQRGPTSAAAVAAVSMQTQASAIFHNPSAQAPPVAEALGPPLPAGNFTANMPGFVGP